MAYLIERLRLWQKFALVGTLALLVAVVAGTSVICGYHQGFQTAQTELDGLTPVRDLITLVQQTQQHRGISASLLSGNAAAQTPRDAKKAQVLATLGKAEASLRDLAERAQRPVVVSQLARIRQDWDSLSGSVGSSGYTAAQSYSAHTELIARQLQLLDEALDASTLRLDPEAASYYLIASLLDALPGLTESLGQARAKGTPMLAKGAAGPDERALMNSLATAARVLATRIHSDLARALAAEPALKKALEKPITDSYQASEAAIALVNDNIVKPDALIFPSQQYLATITAQIDTQFDLINAGFEALQQMLQERAAAARRVLWTVSVCLLLAVLLVGWIIVVTVRSAERTLAHAQAAAQALAHGDLTHEVHATTHDEIGTLARTLGGSMRTLADTLHEIRTATEAVDTAALEIAQGTQDLSSRTEEQASSLQQTTAAVATLSETVQQNSRNAQQANAMAQQASDVAARGGDSVHKVVETMKGINDSSRRIADIITVIDSIAFQTNILALNAAVEAARAGEQGRGFAVVASEVRSLAGRSAQAAAEIKQLISESVARVESGTLLVDEAGDSMQAIVESIEKVAQIMGEISGASAEQTQGIAQIADAIGQMDGMTQQNAALVEQTAAASASLKNQSLQLAQAMARFELRQTPLRLGSIGR
ncbi:methyl-accepting chemotaxis protein [Acidovorax facilis]|uniref:methyl-accepting chemotaxis protein n=1 Tax=Acidovorax facilis TaxID=12917 RepID=UPI003CF70209